MIICAKFEDPPKNYSSPGADFIGLKQIRNASQIKFIFLLIFSTWNIFNWVIINSVLEILEEEYIWM